MRRIAIVALMALFTLSVVTTSAGAASKATHGACKVVKKHGKKHRSCAKPKPKPKPKTPAQPTTPSTPTVPTPPAPAPPTPAPAVEPAPPAAPSITIDPATPSATAPFTITPANLPAAPEGTRFVFAGRLLAVPYSSCVYGFNLIDANVPQVADAARASGGSRTWCTGSWRVSPGMITPDGHGQTIATVEFTISG